MSNNNSFLNFKALSKPLFILLFATVLLIFNSTYLRAATLWLETAPDNLKENALIEFNVGYADEFDLVDLGSRTLGNIVFPQIIGKSGEFTTIKEIAPSWAFVTDGSMQPGSYVAYTSYKPFISGQEGQPTNKYVMTATHIFNIGTAADDLVTKPTGKIPLEIVPSVNPLQIKSGDSVPFQVLLNGKPLPKVVILGEPKGYNPANSPTHARAYYSPTGDDGKFNFTPLKPGLWILSVRHSLPNEKKTESDNVVYIHNFTFFVSNPGPGHGVAAAPAAVATPPAGAPPAGAAPPAATTPPAGAAAPTGAATPQAPAPAQAAGTGAAQAAGSK
ncbi:MAG: DUF4198 domain-containing protein [Deltaproteobacteria bacterium]|jgi:uncharacterized GH25 family protein|nr:DUF4198 domain-containing protein [Deltaproteobacteria bacterium]